MSLWRWGGRHGVSAEAEASVYPLMTLVINSPGDNRGQVKAEENEIRRELTTLQSAYPPHPKVH